ncbi:MAG: hypothetical protein R2831_12485 [Chitinophagaceae bacterium]
MGAKTFQKNERKLIYLMAIIFCFCSCTQPKQKEIITPKIILFLSDFIEKNPKWNQNDIVSKQISDSLQILLSENLNKGLLDSIPIELSEVNEYESGKYAINLEHWAETEIYKKNDIEFELNFNIIGLINDSLVKNIQQNSKYYIKGNFKEFLGRNFSDYISGSVYTPLIQIEKPYSDRYKISLGIMLFDIKDMNISK